jgi:hypothetical protein
MHILPASPPGWGWDSRSRRTAPASSTYTPALCPPRPPPSHDLNWSSLGSSDIDIYTCCLRNLCTPAIWFERAPLLCRVKHSTCATVTTSRAKLYPILVIAAPRAGGRTGSKGVCSKVRTQRRISVDGQKNREEENKRLHFPLCPRSSRPRPMI